MVVKALQGRHVFSRAPGVPFDTRMMIEGNCTSSQKIASSYKKPDISIINRKIELPIIAKVKLFKKAKRARIIKEHQLTSTMAGSSKYPNCQGR